LIWQLNFARQNNGHKKSRFPRKHGSLEENGFLPDKNRPDQAADFLENRFFKEEIQIPLRNQE
jgi:hypothetical protein